MAWKRGRDPEGPVDRWQGRLWEGGVMAYREYLIRKLRRTSATSSALSVVVSKYS